MGGKGNHSVGTRRPWQASAPSGLCGVVVLCEGQVMLGGGHRMSFVVLQPGCPVSVHPMLGSACLVAWCLIKACCNFSTIQTVVQCLSQSCVVECFLKVQIDWLGEEKMTS